MARAPLSQEQQARIPEFVQKWVAIGSTTTPIDHDKAERALRRLYALAGLAEPHICWVPCPISAMLAAIVSVAIRAAGRHGLVRNENALAAFVDRMIRGVLIALVPPSAHRAVQLAVERSVAAALCLPARSSGLAKGINIVEASWFRPLATPFPRSAYKGLRRPLFGAIRHGAILNTLVEPPLNTLGLSLRGKETQQVQDAGFGSPLSLAHAGLLDYVDRVLNIPIEPHFRDTVACCGAYWVLDGMCFAAERPTHINFDVAGRLHCEVGPSVAFPSGWSWWHWHGTTVSQNIIEASETITVEAIQATRRAGLRRVMIERYRRGHDLHGAAAFLRDAGAIRLDDDPAYGTLWCHELSGEEPIVMVEVVNHSPNTQLRPFWCQFVGQLGSDPLAQNGAHSWRSFS